MFDPIAVRNGEYWRLFAFPMITSPIWLLFFCLYSYFVFGTLESSWGEGPLTVFTLFCYTAALGASFISGQPLSVWTHILQNMSLAFGTLFPEMEFLLFFILPVKAKWLALLAGGIFLFQFLIGSLWTKLFLLIVLSPYLIFFKPMLVGIVRLKLKVIKNRNRFGP